MPSLFQFEYPSKILGFPVGMNVWLPDSGKDFETLWMLHGANSECTEWFRDSSMPRYLAKRNMASISVSVYNGFYVDMLHGAPYATFLEEEWVPAVRNLFPCLSRKRESNYIVGASMGGYGSFRVAMNLPDVFSKAGAFAGSIEMPTIVERNARGIQPGGADFQWAFGDYTRMISNKNDVVYMARQCADRGVVPDLYMVCGSDDFGYALNTIARDDLKAAGANVIFREVPGIHSYDCWDPQIEPFLDWLQGKEKNDDI